MLIEFVSIGAFSIGILSIELTLSNSYLNLIQRKKKSLMEQISNREERERGKKKRNRKDERKKIEHSPARYGIERYKCTNEFY